MFWLLCGVVLLARTVNTSTSNFRVLSADDLLELSPWSQSPELLEVAARMGETVTIPINETSQGGVVQDYVTTVLNCTPWLTNFARIRTVKWYLYPLRSLNHDPENYRFPIDPEFIDTYRQRIEGEYNETLTIIRGTIAAESEDPSRGIYECEVCTDEELCLSANTTILNVGRPPIVNRGAGTEPVEQSDDLIKIYKIGSAVCVHIDPTDPASNIPLILSRLRCGDIGSIEELNIPSLLPTATFSWQHISLNRTISAYFAEERESYDIASYDYSPPSEFTRAFPLLVMSDVFSVSTFSPDEISDLDFASDNFTSNISDPSYQALTQAFGIWTCTMTNALGSDSATTVIVNSAECKPTIVSDCTGIGELIGGNNYILEHQSDATIIAGCSVCVLPSVQIWINLTCPTNSDDFGHSVLEYSWTGNDRQYSSEYSYVVEEPGTYTCTATHSDDTSDLATSTVYYIANITLNAVRYNGTNAASSNGCERLLIADPDVKEGDVCLFFDSISAFSERVEINCISNEVDVITRLQGDLTDGHYTAKLDTPKFVMCAVYTGDFSYSPNCATERITIFSYEPAKILRAETICSGIIEGLVTIFEGETVNLCCETVGYPTPESRWYHSMPDNETVFEELVNNISVISDYNIDETTNTLTIINYNETRHKGYYRCQVENLVSNDLTTIEILSGGVCDCQPRIVSVSVTNHAINLTTASVSVTRGTCTSDKGFRYEIDWGDSERDSGSSADVESFTKDHHYMAAGAQYQVTVLYCYASSSISNCSCAEDVNFIHIPIPGTNVCEVGPTDCHSNASCMDQGGGFDCVCKEGYVGNGTFCEGVGIYSRDDNGTDSLCSLCGTELAITVSFSSSVAILMLLLLTTVVIIIIIKIIKTKKKPYRSNTPSDTTIMVIPEASDILELDEIEKSVRLHLQDKNILFSKSQISLSSTIGQGEFGLVYKGYVDINYQAILVAVKTSKTLFSEKEKENLLEEIHKMSLLEHPNVMTLIGVCLNSDMPLIIMPFMSKGSVLDYVKDVGKNRSNIEDKMIRKDFLRIAHQISKGMKYLMSCKLVHRDLAARNCMIDGENVIKVADFGLSEDVYATGYFQANRDDRVARAEKVPIRWLAPESIEHGKYNEKTDVWSFGVTCWEIFTFGRVPYAGIRAMDIFSFLKSEERLEKPDPNICTDQIYDVMNVCWAENPGERPRFASLANTLDNLLEKESHYIDLI